jgi:hypothetical protein
MQAIQALTQVQGVLMEQRSTSEREKIALQEKLDVEKARTTAKQGTVARRATQDKGIGQQSTSLYERRQSTDKRMGSTIGGTTGRSNLEPPAAHCRSRASHST